MPRSVDDLRNELKSLGYLSHGLERWFAHDPWRSGTFWTELLTVASKASLVMAMFAAAVGSSVMLLRNGGLPPLETASIAGLYFIAVFLGALALHVLVALALKTRPAFGIENPRRLTVISMVLSGAVASALVAWWTAFPAQPGAGETITFVALLGVFFFASSIVVAAALLSFAIHETRDIPRIHRRSRTVPLLIGALLLLVLIFARSWNDPLAEARVEAPQVVVRSTGAKVALIAVDGLTPELFELRPQLQEDFDQVTVTRAPAAVSAPEAWATIGTGTPPSLHGVRSVEGVRLFGGTRVVQNVSPLDYLLRVIAPAIGIAERQPLPPSIRDRHYLWESLAERGLPVVAVNWWTTEDRTGGPFHTVSQETVFTQAASGHDDRARIAIAIDATAIAALEQALNDNKARFATVYLPALDVILNRIPIDDRERLTATIKALDQLLALVRDLAQNGWSLVLVGTPGNTQGEAVIATTPDLAIQDAQLEDLAPTILALYGFPPSQEMTGEPLVHAGPRITSYGSRDSDETPEVSDDYYENLKSLGYIQ